MLNVYLQAQKVATEVETAVNTVLAKVEKLRSTKREKTEVCQSFKVVWLQLTKFTWKPNKILLLLLFFY